MQSGGSGGILQQRLNPAAGCDRSSNHLWNLRICNSSSEGKARKTHNALRAPVWCMQANYTLLFGRKARVHLLQTVRWQGGSYSWPACSQTNMVGGWIEGLLDTCGTTVQGARSLHRAPRRPAVRAYSSSHDRAVGVTAIVPRAATACGTAAPLGPVLKPPPGPCPLGCA